MQHFEFRSWKSLAILIAICVTFLILVIGAFQYLPDENNAKLNIESIEENIDATQNENYASIEEENNNEHDSVHEKNVEEEPIENPHRDIKKWSYRDRSLDRFTNDVVEEEHQSHGMPKEEPSFTHREVEIPDLEPINKPEEEGQELDYKAEVNYREKLFELRRACQDYKMQENYKKAIETYIQYLQLCKETYQKLEAYDDLAILYAIEGDYEKAIGCAQQAYKIEPNLKREFILTKLYYKSGNVDKATKRINEILQRDFELK